MKITTFLLILQLVFIVLKTLNVINFSWWLVFIPLYIFVALDILYVFLIVIKEIIEKR